MSPRALQIEKFPYGLHPRSSHFSLVDGVHLFNGRTYMIMNFSCELATSVRMLEFLFQLCCLVARLGWARYLFSLGLSFIICKVEAIVKSFSLGYYENH